MFYDVVHQDNLPPSQNNIMVDALDPDYEARLEREAIIAQQNEWRMWSQPDQDAWQENIDQLLENEDRDRMLFDQVLADCDEGCSECFIDT